MRKLIIVFMLLFIEVTFGSEQPVTVQGSPNWSSISLKATQSSVDKIEGDFNSYSISSTKHVAELIYSVALSQASSNTTNNDTYFYPSVSFGRLLNINSNYTPYVSLEIGYINYKNTTYSSSGTLLGINCGVVYKKSNATDIYLEYSQQKVSLKKGEFKGLIIDSLSMGISLNFF